MEFSFIIKEGEPSAADLCAEILSSPNPPLTEASSDEVERIVEGALAKLHGSDRLIGEQVFETAKALPPLAKAWVNRFLGVFMYSNGTIDGAFDSLNLLVGSSDSEGVVPNEFGFVSEEAESLFQYSDASLAEGPAGELLIDVARLSREKTKSLAQIVVLLSSVSSESVQASIIDGLSELLTHPVDYNVQ